MLAEFDRQILPGLATLVIATLLLIIVLCSPLRSEREIKERAAKKLEKRKRSVDVLNVESKGGD